jgi:hypothetical protein
MKKSRSSLNLFLYSPYSPCTPERVNFGYYLLYARVAYILNYKVIMLLFIKVD